jgi:Photosynthetic reaction centre cytochrome C subunit
MKFGLKEVLPSLMATMLLPMLGIVPAAAQSGVREANQTTAEQKPLMAEQVFKNVQLLKGISVKEFMETMGFFAAATNKTCTTCHGDESGGSWERYADDPPQKQTARKMMLMVDALNKTYFGGKREVTCYSCHRNAERPRITPILAEQYGTPPAEDPEEIPQQAPGAPAPDQVLEKYMQALGGPQKLASFTSFVAKGSYQGYDDPEKSPMEIYAQAPSKFSQFVHTSSGDSAWVDDGRSAWVGQSDANATPVPLMGLAAGDLDGAHVESELYFPAQIKQMLTRLRVGFPVTGVTSILADDIGVGVDDRELTVLQGITAAGTNVKLYFDPKTGLLVRMVRFTSLPVGFIPTEIDYSDYRDVSGIKVPFRVTKTWVDGRSVTELSSIQLNVPIDAAKFAKPILSEPTKSTTAR